MIHLNITVTGFVQGVGFRYATNQQARNLGIKGFVRNQHDGSVYIEAEGESNVLKEFVEWCKRGPAYAEVKDLIVQEGEMRYFKGFETSR